MHYRLRNVDEQIVGRLANALRVRPATARCLAARGCVEPSDAQRFIDPRLAALRPPQGLAGLPRAVERLADAIQKRERIGVFGDYDVDGVTTAALLTSFFRAAGGEVEVAVARRDAGYGFQPAAAADFAKRGCSVIVTGDCGTSDLAALAAAAAFGIDVIVVDHHTVPSAETAHPSFALVNPFRVDSTFPFRGMASVGLAFYVAAAVRTELRDRGHFRTMREPDVRDLLDLVALGTIADLVPLTAENRILVSLGLKRLRRSEQMRPGIAALLTAANVPEDRDVDERMIAWKIGPRINAPGRLGAAEPSLALLLADAASAPERAQALEVANKERRAIQDRVLTEALEMIDRNAAVVGGGVDFAKGSGAFANDIVLGPDRAAIVVAGVGWPSGVVGIVAAKLVDKYQRPAFVVGIDAETGLGRGSARTAGGIDLYRALSEAWRDADLTAASNAAAAASCTPTDTSRAWRYGGHAAAAGFTIGREAMAALADALGVSCAKLAEGSGPRQAGKEIDAEIRLGDVDERLAQELAGLGPFGQANPPPVLVTRNARVTAVRRVGNGSHLKLTLEDGDAAASGDRSPATRSAIAFGLGDREIEVGAHIDLEFLPTVSTWQGRRSAELEVHDFAPSAVASASASASSIDITTAAPPTAERANVVLS
ncbi:MAG: single-stranded-DNA-specific exonuclease RecJ [Myxococcota bacterium]|nr:single-stranded-DNA-specific exonuclease RecJ [Myxococcota bacterium]